MRERERPRLRSVFLPPVFRDEVRNDTAWVLHWLVWSIAAVVTVMILLLIPLLKAEPARFLGQALAVDALCLAMILVMRRGFVELAARVLVAGMWLIALATVWTSSGLESPAVATFLLAAVYMILFIGGKAGVLAVVLVGVSTFGLAAAHAAGAIPEPAVVHTPLSRALTMTLYAVILAAAVELHSRTLARWRGRNERELAERRAAEAEVRALNAELEDRVRERTAALESVVDDLEQANAQLESATRAKSDFLAAMSHELRTPLNSVIGFSGTLASGLTGPLNDEQRRQVEMIGTSGRLLLDLVNQVLDLARVESGGVEISLAEVDVTDVVESVSAVLLPLAQEKGLTLSTTVEDDVGTIRSDFLRVEQALLNLVGNAVKFTEEGSVSVHAFTDDGDVLIEVRDTGIGIEPEELRRVFQRFYQVLPGSGGKLRGTGLGLALTRDLIESLGGTVDGSSVPGSGSVFRIRLPKAALAP